ncbi:PREDICTED: uncharacterized protein LOC102012342 [Chinchilla lanigera]|uniref:uncharacterized protein LOC102012342 n=1 Tax=Chinchilla lanigera TaxID=34839 RepID=UPI00038EB124|nr:PREDICTED: uncharacterized protein LOC102012342 [Chinchilla lanigera]
MSLDSARQDSVASCSMSWDVIPLERAGTTPCLPSASETSDKNFCSRGTAAESGRAEVRLEPPLDGGFAGQTETVSQEEGMAVCWRSLLGLEPPRGDAPTMDFQCPTELLGALQVWPSPGVPEVLTGDRKSFQEISNLSRSRSCYSPTWTSTFGSKQEPSPFFSFPEASVAMLVSVGVSELPGLQVTPKVGPLMPGSRWSVGTWCD